MLLACDQRADRPKVPFGGSAPVLSAGTTSSADLVALSAVSATDRLARQARTRANAGLGVLFAAVLAVTAYRIAAAGEGWLFDCGVGMLVCAVALLRERNRTVATAVGLAVSAAAVLTSELGHLTGEPGVATSLALMVLGGSAVRTLLPRRAAVIASAGLAVMALGWLTTGPRPTAHPAPVQFGVLGWLAAVGVGLALRFLDYRREVAAEMVRRDERLALARELHDVVAHHISGIVLQTQAARIVGRKQPAFEAMDDTLADIERSGTDAMDAMSRVVALLRDTDDGAATTSGPEQLTELVRRFEGHGPAVHLQLPTGNGPWAPEVTTTIYRVVQESLTNIARHARHARSATVAITQDQRGIRVEITDDAPHSPVRRSPRGGYGLVGMRERVEALGGTLSTGPRPGAGWSVHASLPVPSGDRR